MGRHALEFFRKAPFFFAIALLASCATASSRVESPTKKLTLEVPGAATPEGGVFAVSVVSPEAIAEASGLFQGREIEFFPDCKPEANSGCKRYSALVGVEYGTPPGTADFSVKAKVGVENLELRAPVPVKAGVFPSEKLSVPPKTVFPSKKDQKKIMRDRVVLNHAYAVKTATQFWDPPVVMPIASTATSAWGTSRVYNGKKESVHFGTDLRAPMGTPIVAPITGRVAVARFLFYTGYTVILDHGYGLFTIYGHMSKLLVKTGDVLQKGKVMGLSGMTGRASGPHLHWGVNLHGTKVDPNALMLVLNQKG